MPISWKRQSGVSPIPFIPTAPGKAEFIALAALMMAMFPLSLDIVLPALISLGRDLGVMANGSQLMIPMVVFGMAAGQLFYGPVSDAVGRKPAIVAGLALYAIGCVLSLAAVDFTAMLAGRFLQGLGAAGPRIVTVALIRDQYEGPAMARMISIIIAVLMIGPMVAPFLGQGVLFVAPWRALFGVLLGVAIIIFIWFGLRQPETLPRSRRAPFFGWAIVAAIRAICRSRVTLGYSVAAGIAFGELFAYVTSAPQIFQGLYGVGVWFPFFFSVSGVAIALAALVNAGLVMRVGMARLCRYAALAKGLLAAAFFIVAAGQDGTPPLWMSILFLPAAFFCVGILFGNLNALAMEPQGHIAGTAAGIVGSIAFFISVVLGTAIAQSYDGTMLPLVIGIGALSAVSLGVMRWAEP